MAIINVKTINCAQINLYHAELPTEHVFANVEHNYTTPFNEFIQEPYCHKGVPHHTHGNCKIAFDTQIFDPRAMLTISNSMVISTMLGALLRIFCLFYWKNISLTLRLVVWHNHPGLMLRYIILAVKKSIYMKNIKVLKTLSKGLNLNRYLKFSMARKNWKKFNLKNGRKLWG